MEVMGRDRYLHGKDSFPYCFPSFHFLIPPFLFLLIFFPCFFLSSSFLRFIFFFSFSSSLLFVYCNLFIEEEDNFLRLYIKQGHGGGLDV